MNLQQLIEIVAALTKRVETLEAAVAAKRDRGPASEREMTAEDAHRVKFGDHKDTKHKAAADALKLSYGQVYSCRGGYTFKDIKDDGTRNPDGTKKVAAEPAKTEAKA